MPDVRRVSGDACLELGQRVVLYHNLKCERWVWRYFKGPSTPHITIQPKDLITWPPGVAPELNCTTTICCKRGSTHLPYFSFTDYIVDTDRPHTTVWNQLKRFPGSNIGGLMTIYSENNHGLDLKKCYHTKDLEPSRYRCIHSGPYNQTHREHTEQLFNLTSPPSYYSGPKAFIWTNRREGKYCVGRCEANMEAYTSPQNCTWTLHHCFNLTTCGYRTPTQCPKIYPLPPGGLIKGNVNKTLIHDVNLVMAHVNYNISNILSAYVTHCDKHDETYGWLQARLDDLIFDYKGRLAVQISPVRTKRGLFGDLAGLFGSANSISNTYQMTKQSQYSTWLASQVATGFQHLTNSNENIIKAVRSEAQALLSISHSLFNQTRNIERGLACRTYAQDLFTAARQEILDLRLSKTPRHVLNDLIETLDLHRWIASEKLKHLHYSELLTTLMMYTAEECKGCIGFFVSFPLIHPDQVYPNSTTIRSIGVVVKNQVLKFNHLTGYITMRGKETIFTTRPCCHETSSYIICTCNTLQPFSQNDTKLVSVQSLHGHADAIQVSHTQWCVMSEMTAFTYGGLTCPSNHTFCLEVTEDFAMGQVHILGRVPLEVDVSPWWEDTFYEQGTRALTDLMGLVQQVVRDTEYHINQAQVEVDLAKRTAKILASSSTRSAQDAYTWWDWVFRGCVIASALIFTFTLIQCCYFRHLIRSLQTSTHTTLTLSPLQLPSARKPETMARSHVGHFP